MKIEIAENEMIVQSACERVRAANAAGQPVAPRDQVVYDIDHLVMEANSGASYEQYFRWATRQEIKRVVPALRLVGLDDVADLTQQAIKVAFPNGIPADSMKNEVTNWSESQERRLERLFEQLEKYNGRITDALGTYASRAED